MTCFTCARNMHTGHTKAPAIHPSASSSMSQMQLIVRDLPEPPVSVFDIGSASVAWCSCRLTCQRRTPANSTSRSSHHMATNQAALGSKRPPDTASAASSSASNTAESLTSALFRAGPSPRLQAARHKRSDRASCCKIVILSRFACCPSR